MSLTLLTVGAMLGWLVVGESSVVQPDIVGMKNAPPSMQHLFGTDQFSRDVFARVLTGGAISLAIGVFAVLFSTVVGTTYGLVAGYAGGRVETLMIPPVRSVVAAGGALKVSMIWLTVSYILQTVGELSLSPVGLSSMTKLAPEKFGGQMMGVWFLAASLGNLIAGIVGGDVDPEKLEVMTPLFVRTTSSLFIAAIACALLVVPIRRMMRESTTRA